MPAAEYLETVAAWKQLREETKAAMADVDVLLVPTTMVPALPIEKIDQDKETYAIYNMQYLRNTAIGNILGLCGLSVPCGMTGNGLPIGLMIYGKPFDEATVLRVGHTFQQATDWHMRRPDVSWAGE